MCLDSGGDLLYVTSEEDYYNVMQKLLSLFLHSEGRLHLTEAFIGLRRTVWQWLGKHLKLSRIFKALIKLDIKATLTLGTLL